MKNVILIVAVSAITLFGGCTISGKPGGRVGVEWHIVETLVESILPEEREDTELDRNWRAGYGFNNPNPERRRKGLPLLNFDGSEYQD